MTIDLSPRTFTGCPAMRLSVGWATSPTRLSSPSGLFNSNLASSSLCKVTSRPSSSIVTGVPGPDRPPVSAQRRYRFTAFPTFFNSAKSPSQSAAGNFRLEISRVSIVITSLSRDSVQLSVEIWLIWKRMASVWSDIIPNRWGSPSSHKSRDIERKK